MVKRLLKYIPGLCLLMGVSAGWAPSVWAEFVVDLYDGLAKTEDSDVEARVSGETPNGKKLPYGRQALKRKEVKGN